jgi:glycosyltransferase involved in cell wall biosynthesis
MQSRRKAGQKVLVLTYPVKPMFEIKGAEVGMDEISKMTGFSVGEARYFLAVGTLTRRKNLGVLVQAMDYLVGSNKDVKLLLIGREGFDAHYIKEELALAHQAESKVVILEGVGDAELEVLISKSSGVLFPSTAEGFGLPIIEATAANKRVVVSDIEPMRTIGKSYGATILPPDDILAWRDAMLKILEGDIAIQTDKSEAELSWESWAEIVCS